MKLTGKQKNYLRGVAHSLNPVVSIGGKGLTESVLEELKIALAHHEIIKIKLPSASKAEKTQLLDQLCGDLDAEPVQLIGRVGVLYKPADTPKLDLPSF